MFLLFLVSVVVVGLASLGFAQVSALQHRQTETSAASHGGSEGSALYSQIDVSRADAPPCANGGSGDLVFQPVNGTSSTLHYSYAAGGQCGSGGAGSPGQQCALCVLSSTATDFQINRPVALEGQVAINGNVNLKHNGELCSDLPGHPQCDGSGSIYVGGTCCGAGTLTPGAQPLNITIDDPLQGLYPKPAITNPGNPAAAIKPSGVYSTTLTGTLASGGVFVVTGTLQGPIAVQADYTSTTSTTYAANNTVTDAGAAWGVNKWAGRWIRQGALGTANVALIVSNTSNTLTLASSLGQPAWSPSKPSNGTVFSIDGTAFIYLNGADVQIGQNQDVAIAGPASGPYAGASVVASATDTQPINFSGQSTMWLNGSLEAPEMAVTVNGGGVSGLGIDMSGGRVVVSSISALVSNNSTGLVVNGSFPGQSGCNVYDNSLTWQQGPTQRGQGRARVQSSCSGGTGILNFDYNP